MQLQNGLKLLKVVFGLLQLSESVVPVEAVVFSGPHEEQELEPVTDL